jgi:uncharacterized protein YabN with tetrapyrrole methylase and pyrophosphatase domain
MGRMQRLLATMRRLRAPGGCPWDQQQTHETLRPYLLEEAAEAVDALATGDPHVMADELGDVLLQVAFHAVIAEEVGSFSYQDVESAIVEKLVRRHPHVFEAVEVDGVAGVLRNWHAIKAAEREAGGGSPSGPADAVPRSLPALRRAAELDRVLGWQPDPQLAAAPLAAGVAAGTAAAFGAALLCLAQLARRAGVDPELALRDALAERLETPT